MNRLAETVQMKGHNMFLCRINKNYPQLSPNTPSYLELWFTVFQLILLYPGHTKYVEEYIVFVFLSICPSFSDSVHPSIQVLTFYVKVLREIVLLFLIFFANLPFRLFTYD